MARLEIISAAIVFGAGLIYYVMRIARINRKEAMKKADRLNKKTALNTQDKADKELDEKTRKEEEEQERSCSKTMWGSVALVVVVYIAIKIAQYCGILPLEAAAYLKYILALYCLVWVYIGVRG